MTKKAFTYIPIILTLLFMLSGCSQSVGSISSMTIIYGLITAVSLLLVSGYCTLMKKREPWLLLLYIAVFVVNCGYLAISMSKTLDGALFANRIAYLGSVFLPFSMLLTIMDVCQIKYKKKTPIALLILSAVVFLIAASPGYLDWYYKDVSVNMINGVAVLDKEYGPLHPIYLVYLLGYFSAMIAVITYSIFKKRITTGAHAAILASAVLGNIAVWGIEQVIELQFEFLSISYIVTELFLLMLFIMLQQYEPLLSPIPDDVIHPGPAEDENKIEDAPEIAVTTDTTNEQDGYEFFCDNLETLTAAEKNIYEMYVGGKSTKEIIEALEITENTLKTHNRRIYKKLGVSSRKQMLEYAKQKRKRG